MAFFFLKSFVTLFIFWFIFYFVKRHLKVLKADFMLKKALLSYRAKEYNKSVSFLMKGFIYPGRMGVSLKEANLNVRNLELLDLIFLHENLDSERLTLPLRSLLMSVSETSKVKKEHFDKIMLFYSECVEIKKIDQEYLNSISSTQFSSPQFKTNWLTGKIRKDSLLLS